MWHGKNILLPYFQVLHNFSPHKNICVKSIGSLYRWNCKWLKCQGIAPLPCYYTSAGNQIHQLMPLASLYGSNMCLWGWAGESAPKQNKVPSSLFSRLPRCPCKPPLHRCPVQFDTDAKNIFVLLAPPGYETCLDMVEFWPWEQLTQARRPTIVVFLDDYCHSRRSWRMPHSWLGNNSGKGNTQYSPCPTKD